MSSYAVAQRSCLPNFDHDAVLFNYKDMLLIFYDWITF